MDGSHWSGPYLRFNGTNTTLSCKVSNETNFQIDTEGQMTYPCSRPLTVATASVTLSSMPKYIGSFFNANLIKSSVFLVLVALNNIVCRFFGKYFTILFISSSNPTSRMRSASSMIKHCRFLYTNLVVFCK